MQRQISYAKFLESRTLLNRPVRDSMLVGGFTMFKELEDAKKHCVNLKLFIVSFTLTQWSETDLYPQLHDGEIPKAFGYFVAYGENNNECCVFEDFPY